MAQPSTRQQETVVGSLWKDGGRTRRVLDILDILTTPMALLAVLIVVVAVNLFLYFGYHAPAVLPEPSAEPTSLAEEGTSPSTVPGPTGGQEEGGRRLRETTGEETAVPSRGAATTASPSASPSASASPSPP